MCLPFYTTGPGIPYHTLVNTIDNESEPDLVLENNDRFSSLIAGIEMPTVIRDTFDLHGYSKYTLLYAKPTIEDIPVIYNILLILGQHTNDVIAKLAIPFSIWSKIWLTRELSYPTTANKEHGMCSFCISPPLKHAFICICVFLTELWYKLVLPPGFDKSKKYPLLIDV